ncbi:MAG TPA: sigma 54-interacting transcriptional regulator [Geminicoccaceae bacterium]|nr:sigma 54-interacting transcriptional regulator [Geminicoccus sp.]HMU51177.1 sigma 54-interacting transcriptional regulator [Geminicoccaceae bacterium]
MSRAEPIVPPFIGQSPPVEAMLARVSALAAIDRPVLVVGERGTGKELVAARLHYLSRRWQRPFVKLNVAAVAETLLDSELFGHEAGAFTGAARRHEGRFERADGGTLFLDEIATAGAAVQEKLLRVVEYGEIDRVGGRETLAVDVRLIGATNLHLPAEVAAGRFRADLLDRLAFEVVRLPPLRERGEDVELLAGHFGRAMAVELGWAGYPGVTPGFIAALRRHDWPGNVRELRNAVERSLARWPHPARPVADAAIDPFENGGAVPSAVSAPEPEGPLDERVAAYERRLLEEALQAARFNRRLAARRLGLSYEQLRVRLRRQGLTTAG